LNTIRNFSLSRYEVLTFLNPNHLKTLYIDDFLKRFKDYDHCLVKMAEKKRVAEVISSDEDSMPTPEKKRKTAAMQTFRREYSNKYPWILKSIKGISYARCTVCVSDFLISHGGEFDIKKHAKTLKHQHNFKLQEDSSKWKLEKFFVKTDSEMEHAVTNAECLLQ